MAGRHPRSTSIGEYQPFNIVTTGNAGIATTRLPTTPSATTPALEYGHGVFLGTVTLNDFGAPLSLAAPLVAATTSGASTTGGDLAGGKSYSFAFTWTTSAGETLASPAVTYSVPAGTSTNQITLTATTSLPSVATGTAWYCTASTDTAAVIGSIATSATNSLAVTTAPSTWNAAIQPPTPFVLSLYNGNPSSGGHQFASIKAITNVTLEFQAACDNGIWYSLAANTGGSGTFSATLNVLPVTV